MSGVSRYIPGSSSVSSRLSSAAERFVRLDRGRALARTTQLGTPSQAIEIDSDEERESSLLNDHDLNFNYSTSKPAAMTAPHPDTKGTEPSGNTRLSLKRKLNEYLKSSDTVEIYVGPELEKWTLNEELLCDRIPYFKAAFKNGFKESKDKKLELPEDNPDVFGHLIDWLYMENFDCTVCEDYDKPASREGKENPNHLLLWAQLWALADKLGCEKLMDWARTKFICCMAGVEFGVSPEVISFVFEETRENCFLRTWLPLEFVRLFFQSGSYPDTFGEAAAASKTFNAEFLKQIKAHFGEEKGHCYIDGCIFHEAGNKKS